MKNSYDKTGIWTPEQGDWNDSPTLYPLHHQNPKKLLFIVCVIAPSHLCRDASEAFPSPSALYFFSAMLLFSTGRIDWFSYQEPWELW
jgi:hypothetical protein